MDLQATVRQFLQQMVTKGELAFFLVEPTSKALLKVSCKTVSDLKKLDEATWAGLKLALDTTQKLRAHLELYPDVNVPQVVVLTEENVPPETPSPEELKRIEDHKRARRISMELKNLTTEQQQEMRKKNFSRIENRRVVEENKRRRVLEDKRKKLLEEQRSQEEKYKQMEEKKSQMIKELEEKKEIIGRTEITRRKIQANGREEEPNDQRAGRKEKSHGGQQTERGQREAFSESNTQTTESP
eukprot:TRINITY_DN6551_c0_g1_i1.p1 TRINITY_DN6551_c0_g1~~TRINITY_DN6551_c0_g1_i1.p1  ORF type:complete len:242 (-),score=83.84 TRINITY_DN6551_c0_g1_i1:516-1241(-)